MKIINYVIGKDNKSKIFYDIFSRLSNYFTYKYSDEYYLVVSELPIDNAHIYHYHRPQFNGITHHPSVVTVHHDLSDTDLSLDEKVFLEEYKKSDLVICLNSNQKKYLAEKGINHTTIIPHGYDNRLKDYKSKSKNTSKLTIGYISKRYGRRVKGEPYLVDLMRRLDPSKVDFVFVGAGRREEASIARGYGYDVQCFEYLPYSTLLTIYPYIDCLLMCSDSEGGPANVPEALASQTPVLGFDIGLVTDLVSDGQNGFILTGDPSVDSILIDKISNDSSIIDSLVHNWFTPHSLITWEDNFEQHIECYKKITSQTEKIELLNKDEMRIPYPPKNIRLEYQFPKVISIGDYITINVSIINDERIFSEKEILNSNMYIAVKKYESKTESKEVFRQHISNKLDIGINFIKFSFLLDKNVNDHPLSIDLLCDHLGWFNSDLEKFSVKVI